MRLHWRFLRNSLVNTYQNKKWITAFLKKGFKNSKVEKILKICYKEFSQCSIFKYIIILRIVFLYIYFTFGPPYENKSCLNDLKLWGASENHKSSICWKFQLFISCGTQKSAKTPLPVAKMICPFIGYKPILFQLWNVNLMLNLR